ncbi:endonuclease [Leptospira gomenensis]|nr:endonuclease [Leptospira gomenensis]
MTWNVPGVSGKKIAITGTNGAGKSTLLDLISMAWFGTAPNRKSRSGRDEGAIYECFTKKDSFIEVEAEFGNDICLVKRLIDPNAKTQKPYLYWNGKAVTEGKIKEFGEKFFQLTNLNESVFLSAVYHAQNGKGHVVGLDQKSARALIDDLLDLWKFDEEFEEFDTLRKSIETEVSGDILVLKNLSDGKEEPVLLRTQIDSTKQTIETIESGLALFRKAESEAVQSLADLKANALETREYLDKKDRLEKEYYTEIEALKNLTTRRDNNQVLVLDRKAEILQAVEENEQFGKKILLHKKILNQLQDQFFSVNAVIDEEARAYKAEIENLQTKIVSLEENRDIEKASVSSFNSLLTRVQTELQQARKSSALLSEVPCKGKIVEGVDLPEACPLLKDARSNHSRILDLETEELKLKNSLADRPDVETPVLEARAELKFAQAGLELLRIDPRIIALKEKESENGAVIREIESVLNDSKFKDLLKMAPELSVADERVKEYDRQINSVSERISNIDSELYSVNEFLSTVSEVSKTIEEKEEALSKIRANIEDQTEEQKKHIATLGGLVSRLEKAVETQARIEEFQKSISEKYERLTLLKTLCEGLSPKGARALKLDAAGPEISATINAILSECFGGRFKVRLSTIKETGSGKDKEDFSILVLDNETGIETLVENKSGGEAAIIKEAISLGMAAYKRNKTNADIRTLIRDESDGGLTSENAHFYQKMLDRALTEGRFEQVIFISHKKEIQEIADRIFFVKDGKVTEVAA